MSYDENGLYQEQEQGTWDSNGTKYKMNKILEIAHDKEVKMFPMKDLKSLNESSKKTVEGELVCGSCYDLVNDKTKAREDHQMRVNRVNTSIPIILSKEGAEWWVVDGAHRLEKAIFTKQDYLPVKFIEWSELQEARVDEG